jgi:hypothetical protein
VAAVALVGSAAASEVVMKPERLQVNWHMINWRDFNECKAMIERADAQEGIPLEEDERPRRTHRHIVRSRVRDALDTH